MYRYSVDSAVTYTSEDLVLFKESPFASWMERLTVENPGHGIAPDAGSQPPGNSMQRQDDVAEILRAEGRQVRLIEWEETESERRGATMEAMREGIDFIINGQLAVGPLSGSANLLMRTSGFSELGDYLYVPCDTQGKTNLHSAFRLCFLADLLHSLQGVLSPRMLIVRGGADLVPLQTEDHIYHYLAVKHRFMDAQRQFRKHRMPDPSVSAHFGRWSDCANQVLRQRALAQPPETLASDLAPLVNEDPREPVAELAERRRHRSSPPGLDDHYFPAPGSSAPIDVPGPHPLDSPGFNVAVRQQAVSQPEAIATRRPVVDQDDDRADEFSPVPFSSSLNTSAAFER
ncbi:hypothetical protein CWI75_08890 [Kineobactrum sediminis]|uniref:Uncharacterized protein n=1 Tax=Kineobactrum sediminis TaxID=1905677 RepID=A0A2N5Y2T3_9GAMM|nr:hypothetical protein [Kineobactrum sediminis]PLW82688.1 hypothetical protein CWI75_08890 [Kineobactrum sediminis]